MLIDTRHDMDKLSYYFELSRLFSDLNCMIAAFQTRIRLVAAEFCFCCRVGNLQQLLPYCSLAASGRHFWQVDFLKQVYCYILF